MTGMSKKSKVFIAALLGVVVLGLSKSGRTSEFAKIRSAYAGGIDASSIPALGNATSAITPIIDGAFELALKGSKIPVAGPALVSPLVSGIYGLVWGWTY